MSIHAIVLISIFTVMIVIVACLIWYSVEAFEQHSTAYDMVTKIPQAVINDYSVKPFEHSEEEAYNLKHALVSLVVYGGLPDDVVGEILDNVYAQEQEDFPGTDEHLIWLLPNLFDFDRTPQGYNYWIAIDCQLDLLMEGRDPQVEEWIREALE